MVLFASDVDLSGRWGNVINKATIFNGLIRFRNNENGHIAVITALLGVPLVMMAGYAIDYNRAYSQRSGLASAIDAAALASVIPDNLTTDEREAYAQDMFDENYLGTLAVKLDINSTREQVDIMALAEVPTLFGGIIGKNYIPIKEDGSAKLTKSDVVCVLALDPTGERAIEFLDDARYSSPGCSVQANSIHNLAMNSEIVTPPVAKSFCVGGISRGNYDPFVKHACSPVEDPYVDLEVPAAGRRCNDVGQIYIRPSGRSRAGRFYRESELAPDRFGNTVIPDYSTLTPGIYCRGLTFDGGEVDLSPGVYHVWGDLEFTGATSVKGDGVTFILKGTNNRLIIRDGAVVNLKAPSTGVTAGLVFWQIYLDFVPYLFGKIPPSPGRAIATSEISSGGGLKIVGTAYLPDHELIVSSDSPVASQSPATSFIAYRIKFTDKANMYVRVDHETGGIPPMLPRSDDGAKLVTEKLPETPPDEDDDD